MSGLEMVAVVVGGGGSGGGSGGVSGCTVKVRVV